MAKDELPRLDVFEGLRKWGEVRLRPQHLENLTYIELRRDGEEEWKPLLAFIAVEGKIMTRLLVGNSGRQFVYEPLTNSLSDVSRARGVDNNSNLRSGETRQDDNRRRDDS